MTEENEAVLQECEKEDIRLVTLQFVDMLGTSNNVTIRTENLKEALTNGKSFDGSSIEGFVRIYESYMVVMPDSSTFHITPWRPGARTYEAFSKELVF